MEVLKLKQPLYLAMLGAIIATVLLYGIPFSNSLQLLWQIVISYDTITVLLILYLITFLQKMMEAKNQLSLAQKDLNGLFNNRRINASLASIFIGLLPSAAAVIICGNIVKESAGELLCPEEGLCR